MQVNLYNRATVGLLLGALMVMLFTGASFAQDADDKLLAETDDLLIYRDEDGRIKIKHADGDEDEWIAVINVDDDGDNVFFWNSDNNFRTKFRTPRVFSFNGDDGDFTFDGDMGLDELGDWVSDLRDGIRVHSMDQVMPLIAGHPFSEERSEISRMDMKARRLARKMRNAEGEEQTQLEAEMDELLGEIFDRKQALRRQELTKLEERADDVRAHYDERQRNRAEIIARRKRDLLGSRDPLRW